MARNIEIKASVVSLQGLMEAAAALASISTGWKD